jgi:CRP/FNR family transcriptional regulator, polysaccharide utilization system transcription regulator
LASDFNPIERTAKAQKLSCHACGARARAVVCNVPGRDGLDFERMKCTLRYAPGQTVFYQGHPALGLYILCTGKVKLTRRAARGGRRTVRIVESGALLELQAFGDEAVHEATCEVLEDSQVCLVPRLEYERLVQRSGDLAASIIRLLGRELGSRAERLDAMVGAPARQRLGWLLRIWPTGSAAPRPARSRSASRLSGRSWQKWPASPPKR